MTTSAPRVVKTLRELILSDTLPVNAMGKVRRTGLLKLAGLDRHPRET